MGRGATASRLSTYGFADLANSCAGRLANEKACRDFCVTVLPKLFFVEKACPAVRTDPERFIAVAQMVNNAGS